ncbi:MAG: ABC transporter ATP-binding protein [Bacteroidales bacterium]|nr:ABC transporter ATP-binding protein [Bacteroidales bacterium]MDD4673237.1 ABC transporter ATP-binding protein [Bacteroidales bacterium]
MQKGTFSVSIQNVELGYSKGKPLLPKFSVDTHSGELIALIGRNGIGKSTLLRSIMGLQMPMSGAIYVDGVPVSKLCRKQKSKALSFVPAESVRVANLHVRDFVAIARFPHLGWTRTLSATDWEKVNYALALVNISHLAQRDIATISDGELQRAMVAFALAQDTRIIILDEPTAFLDLPNKFEMVSLLSDLAQNNGKTIIYSTHDLQGAIHEADTIWMMLKDGLFSGAPEDLALNGKFEKFLADSEVLFDMGSGLFRNQRRSSKAIVFEGEGRAAIWTVKMLERIGFDVKSDGEGLKVMSNERGNSTEWTVTNNDNQLFKTHTLYELAQKLREVNS